MTGPQAHGMVEVAPGGTCPACRDQLSEARPGHSVIIAYKPRYLCKGHREAWQRADRAGRERWGERWL